MAFVSDAGERWAWTENRVHELRRLIEMGLRSPQVAKELQAPSDGCVRMKARRLGLEWLAEKGRPQLEPRVRAERQAAEPVREALKPERWPPIPMPELRWIETPGRRVTLMELPEVGLCKWPMSHVMEPGSSRTLFCGCRTQGLVYCPSHEAIARRENERISLVA